MSRYEQLAKFLAARTEGYWEAEFAEIEEQLGFRLPPSARKYPAWWANQRGAGHSQAQGWRSVGWRTSRLDLKHRRVRFVRDRSEDSGTSANASAYDNRQRLWDEACGLTGITDREQLIGEALRALIEREAARRLARLGGTMPTFHPPARERP